MFETSKESISRFTKILMPLMGLELANWIPHLMMFVFLGSFGDPFPIACFGLSNFLINILIWPIIISITDVAGAMFAICYGSQRFSEIINNFYRIIIVLVFLMFGYFVLSIFGKEIFIAMNVDPDIAESAAYLFKWSGVFVGLSIITRFLQSFMFAQGKCQEFLVINFVSLILGVGLSGLFIIYYDMRQYGVIPARIIQESVGALYTVFVFFQKADPKTVGKLNVSKVFKGYVKFLVKILKSAIGTILEWTTFEINTYLAIQLHNVHQLAVFLTFAGFGPLFFVIGHALSSTVGVIIGNLLGEGKNAAAKKELKAIFFYIFIFAIFNAIILVVFRNQIAWLYIKNQELSEYFAQIIMILAISQWAYMMFYPVFQTFRLLEMENFFVTILGTQYIFSDLFFALLFCFYFHLNSMGLVIAHGLSAVTAIFIFIWKIFYNTNWKDKKFSDRKSAILSDEDKLKESGEEHSKLIVKEEKE